MNTPRFDTPKAMFVGVVTIALIGAAVLFAARKVDREARFGEMTALIVRDVTALDQSLRPGGEGTIKLSPTEATELVLLPAYCSSQKIDDLFPDKNRSFKRTLIRSSRDDHTSPALVWVRNREILAICRFKVAVGLLSTLQRKDISNENPELRVARESTLKEPFISLYFVDP